MENYDKNVSMKCGISAVEITIDIYWTALAFGSNQRVEIYCQEHQCTVKWERKNIYQQTI